MPIVGPLSASAGSPYIPLTGSLVLIGESTTFITGSTLITGSITITGSLITSGSTLVTGSAVVTGSMIITGSLTVSGSDTFTVFGPSIFNEGGATDSDFRVETGDEDEALFIDSANNRLYVNKGETSFITTVGNSNDEALRINAAGVVFNMDAHTANDFRIASLNKSHALFVDSSTNQVLILSGGSGPDHSPAAADVNFYVSGTAGSAATLTRGTSLFGGDVSVSGSIHVGYSVYNQSDPDTRITFESNTIKLIAGDDNMFSANSTSGFITLNSDEGAYTTAIKTANKLAIAAKNSTDQVLILSGGAGVSFDEASATDVNFYVSGSSGALGTANRGASVFGGDIFVSGALKVFYSGSSGGGSISGSIHETALGASYLVAGSNVTIASASNGQVTISTAAGSIDGSGAATRIAYWSDADTLTSDADLIFDGDTLTAANSSNTAIPAITIDRNYTGTTDIGNYTTDPQGLLVDYDVTGIVASGQTQVHDAIAVHYNQDSPTMVGTINATAADIRMTAGSSGTQSMKGAAITLAGPVRVGSTYTGVDVTAPNDSAHFIARSSDALLDYFKISVGASGATTLSTSDADAAVANLTLSAEGKIVIDAVAGDETVFNESAADINFRVESTSIPGIIVADAGTNQLLLHSSGTHASTAGAVAGSDVAIYLSGAVGSRDVPNSKGAAVFTGDLVVSGGLLVKNGPFSGGSISGSIHETSIGASYLVAGSNVTIVSASNGQVTISSTGGGSGISWDGSTANGIATFKDADEATVETNFTFNGTDGLIASAGRMQFRDLGLFIHSPADGQLAIEADTTLSLTGSGAAINAVAIMANNVGGGIDVDSGTGGYNNTSTGVLALSSSFNDPSAIQITATAGGMDITCEGAAGEDIDIVNANGSIRIVAEENVPDAIEIVAVPGGIILSANDTTSGIQIAAGNSGVPVLIGHTTSETTVQDNLSVTGNLTVNGALAEISGTLSIEATGTEAIRISKADSDTREIVFEQNGSDIASIFCNAAESLRIKNETTNGTIILQARDSSTTFNILSIVGETQAVGINTTSPAGILDAQGLMPAPGTHASSQVFILSGSGSPLSTNESLYSDTALFVSGGIGTKDTAIKGTSVFGGDLVSSGSIFGTMKHFYHFSANVTNVNENWLKSGGNDAGSPFDRGNHQWIAPYGGKLQAATVRSDATDGVNSLDVKFYSSPGGDATSGGTTKTSNFIISSTDIAFSDILLDHSIAPGDSLGVSVQRAGTNPGKVNVTLIVEYDIMSNII